MRLSDFDFALPEASIARYPTAERDASRLLVVSRARGAWEHRSFRDLPELLTRGDLLVVNDTRVRPARLWARKNTGGRVEILLVETASLDGRRFRAMVQASKPVREGLELALEADPTVRVAVISREDGGFAELRFSEDAREVAARVGSVPLPPYLRREPEAIDRERYQTVYAHEGAGESVAAPTAGLHFTPAVLDALEGRGVRRAALTLEVGPGTFLPVRTEEIDLHVMHAERFEIPEATAASVNGARRSGRIVAVGTTVARVLEHAGPALRPGAGTTSLFIRPGHRFHSVDVLLTNFHLPRSTLLMLVSAFAGRDLVLRAYDEAVREGYRFFSYGDAMLVL